MKEDRTEVRGCLKEKWTKVRDKNTRDGVRQI